MGDLRRTCAEIGFTGVQTYVASGNVLFLSDETKQAVKTVLEDRMRGYVGKPIGVIVRTASEVRAIPEDNPFPDKEPKHTVAIHPLSQAVKRRTGTGTGSRAV